MELTFDAVHNHFGTHEKIALFLGFITEKSSAKRKTNAISRVCNWRRIGIPVRYYSKLEKEIAKD